MYCMVFVTVCKIKIPHKGCYVTYGNIYSNEKKNCFSLADQLMKLTKTSILAVAHIPTFYFMVAISNENMAKAFFSINIWSINYIFRVFPVTYGLQKSKDPV